MRLLIINHEFPPVGGGASTACAYIARYLASAGSDVEIITSAFGDLPREEKRDNYFIRRVYSGRDKIHTGGVFEFILFVVSASAVLLRGLKDVRPDLIYAFFTLPSGIIALMIKKIYKIPYFTFLRGIDVPGFYGGRYSFLNRWLAPFIKYIWLNANAVIANSEALRELARETLGVDKDISILPNMVDTSVFYPVSISRDNDTTKIFFAGRLNRQKGIDYLLEAVRMLMKITSVDFIVKIVGDGPEKDRLVRKTAELKMSERIIFSGWKDRADIVREYNKADIFITPSLFEGMPNALLEAMACGLPIVASDIPAHRELIEDNKNGLIVPVKNPGALAESLKVLIEDKGLQSKMREENLKKIRDYDWRNIAAWLTMLNISGLNKFREVA